MDTIPSKQFLDALARGSPIYDVATLNRYVRDDLEMIRAVDPDLIVGDFRLSLSVSARLAKVSYAAIANAYWSPDFSVGAFPLPSLPLTRWMPLGVASRVFGLARAAAFAMHCKPLNRVRLEHGLPSLGKDLRKVYTDADHVLYADLPTMFPIQNLSPGHRFLGPILWSPPDTKPPWWADLPIDLPIVYLTLGSSGSTRLTDLALSALADEPVSVLVSVAGGKLANPAPSNAFVADYLPGAEAAKRAALVICNGGSPTSQQALAAGTPVLGIAANMDQFLNMRAVEAAGAGLVLRADRVGAKDIRDNVRALLASEQHRAAARKLAREIAECHAGERFARFVADLDLHRR